MRIHTNKLKRIRARQHNNRLTVQNKISELRKQLQQVKGNPKLSSAERAKKINTLKKQIQHFETEVTEIVKQEKQPDISPVQTEPIEPIAAEQTAKDKTMPLQPQKQFDSFAHQPETPTAGIYKPSHDETGNTSITFHTPQPTTKQQKPS